MAKTLLDMIAENANTKRGQNRATFLALQEEIAQGIHAGWPVKTIWETLRKIGKISFCYETFNNYTKRYIKQKMSVPTVMPSSSENKKLNQKRTEIPAEIMGFKYNPIPNVKELF